MMSLYGDLRKSMMEADKRPVETIDYFGDQCCVCGKETTNKARHTVYTANITSVTQKTGFKETTTTTRIRDITSGCWKTSQWRGAFSADG
jgi:hypothetical protein